MNDPQERCRAGQIGGAAAESNAQPRELERPADDAERQQRANQVDRDVAGVIAANVEAADRIVEGEGQIDDRAPGNRSVGLRNKHARRLPPLTNLAVVDDRRLVVENKRAGQAVRIGEKSGDDDERGAPPQATRRGSWRGRMFKRAALGFRDGSSRHRSG
jgi:hypothetical protein